MHQLVRKGCRDSINHLSRGDNLFLEIKKENLKQMGDEVMSLNHLTPLISGFPSLLSPVF